MRWLGHSECLNSLCRAYEYILAHLSFYAKSKGEPAEKKLLASDLYDKPTSNDIFLFIFFYKDLAATLAKTSKQLQSKDIRIRNVGCQILSLCTMLKINYSETSQTPTLLLGEGAADDIMSELFGKDMDGIQNPTKSLRTKPLLHLIKLILKNYIFINKFFYIIKKL